MWNVKQNKLKLISNHNPSCCNHTFNSYKLRKWLGEKSGYDVLKSDDNSLRTVKSYQGDQTSIASLSYMYLTQYSVNNFFLGHDFANEINLAVWVKNELNIWLLVCTCMWESGKEKCHTSTFFSQFFSFLFNDCTTVMNPTASDVEAPSIVCCSISVRAWNIKQNTQCVLN